MLVVLILLVTSAAGSSGVEIRAFCGEDSVLNCTATPKSGVRYRAVRWHKVSEEEPQKATGILSKSLWNNSTVQIYHGVDRSVDLVSNSRHLLLRNVTAQDSGKYNCFLAAPVGEENVEGHIFLRVSGCPMDSAQKDVIFEVIVCVSLISALLICFICWVCLKNISFLKNRKKGLANENFNAPLQKKKMKLIYTPGFNGLGPSYQHVCV
ncbi:hypothetical protein GJAV_G00017780 [Gymnothorax javanicus]|nr:hypothetical protein GJAV_G00017780 [Gymnothorax javanicus]